MSASTTDFQLTSGYDFVKTFTDTAFRAINALPPETARAVALYGSRFLKRTRVVDAARINQNLWSLLFSNPIGLAAGFDKNATAIDSLAKIGFGFIEIGSITKRRRRGNRDSPRLFRLREDMALINRLGLPNDGLESVERRLRRYFNKTNKSSSVKLDKIRPVLGANIAPDPSSLHDTALCSEELVDCFTALQPIVDYITLNVSCPNVEYKLRDFYTVNRVAKMIDGMRKVEPGRRRVALLLKISPDLMPSEYLGFADFAKDGGCDGLIVGNTTHSREPTLRSSEKNQQGGLSGKPLAGTVDDMLRDIYKHTEGKVTLIGCGGVFSARDAIQKILNGASLVQMYTGLAYLGPKLIDQMRFDFSTLLRQQKLESIGQAVGRAID